MGLHPSIDDTPILEHDCTILLGGGGLGGGDGPGLGPGPGVGPGLGPGPGVGPGLGPGPGVGPGLGPGPGIGPGTGLPLQDGSIGSSGKTTTGMVVRGGGDSAHELRLQH